MHTWALRSLHTTVITGATGLLLLAPSTASADQTIDPNDNNATEATAPGLYAAGSTAQQAGQHMHSAGQHAANPHTVSDPPAERGARADSSTESAATDEHTEPQAATTAPEQPAVPWAGARDGAAPMPQTPPRNPGHGLLKGMLPTTTAAQTPASVDSRGPLGYRHTLNELAGKHHIQ